MLEERTIEGEFASIDDRLFTLSAPVTGNYTPDQLDALLLEGLQGEATEMTDPDWEKLRRIATGQE